MKGQVMQGISYLCPVIVLLIVSVWQRLHISCLEVCLIFISQGWYDHFNMKIIYFAIHFLFKIVFLFLNYTLNSLETAGFLLRSFLLFLFFPVSHGNCSQTLHIVEMASKIVIWYHHIAPPTMFNRSSPRWRSSEWHWLDCVWSESACFCSRLQRGPVGSSWPCPGASHTVGWASVLWVKHTH